MRSTVRSLVVFCLLIAAACAGGPPVAPVGAQALGLRVDASPLPLKLDEPQLRRVGRLLWRGGVVLSANSANFGGWSDLHVTSDGRQLTAISDLGSWLVAAIDYDSDANLAGLSNARIASLRGLDDRPLADKALADAEAMARLPDGSWLVSFERRHRFWRYPTLDGTPTAFEGPPDLDRQPDNGGVEGLTVLADGRIVALSEEYSLRPGTIVGWIGTPSGGGRYAWRSFDYATIPDFRPTAIVQLPDGSLATVERAFDFTRGVRCRVMHFPLAQVQPGATVRPEELARLASPHAVDNLEGLAASRGPRGETLLWLMSDDNFNPLQRNMLLLFELVP